MGSRVCHLVIRGPTVARRFIFGPIGPKFLYVNGVVIPFHAMKAYTSALDDHFTFRPLYPFERTPGPSAGEAGYSPAQSGNFGSTHFSQNHTAVVFRNSLYSPGLTAIPNPLTCLQDVAAGHYPKPD